MTTEETTILTNMLTLGDKVLSNDLAVEDAVNAINVVTAGIPDYNIGLIEEDVRGIIEKSTVTNKAVTSKIINSLTAVASSRDRLLGLLDVRTFDASDIVAARAFVDNALAGTIDDFTYFNSVVKIAITLADSTRIKAAITKIQSLGA